MEQTVIDIKMLKKYLLGDITEPEQQKIEQSLGDDDFFDHLLVVEQGLIDDYFSNNLTKHERQLFVDNFLASPRRHEKLQVAKTLQEYAADSLRRTRTVQEVKSPSLVQRAYSVFQEYKAAILSYAAAAAILALVFCGIWINSLRNHLLSIQAERERQQSQQDELQRQLADLLEEREKAAQQTKAQIDNNQNMNNSGPNRKAIEELNSNTKRPRNSPPKQDMLAGVTIQAEPDSYFVEESGLKGPDERKQVTIIQHGTGFILQLALNGPANYKLYRAVLRTVEGKEIATVENLQLKSTNKGEVITLSINGRLPVNDYTIVLFGDGEKKVGGYFFSVSR
jgi:hypothetical protein